MPAHALLPLLPALARAGAVFGVASLWGRGGGLLTALRDDNDGPLQFGCSELPKGAVINGEHWNDMTHLAILLVLPQKEGGVRVFALPGEEVSTQAKLAGVLGEAAEAPQAASRHSLPALDALLTTGEAQAVELDVLSIDFDLEASPFQAFQGGTDPSATELSDALEALEEEGIDQGHFVEMFVDEVRISLDPGVDLAPALTGASVRDWLVEAGHLEA